MKKAIFLILAIFIVANYSCINKDKYKETDLFEEFETNDGFTILHLPPVLFKILFSASDEQKPESKELLDKINVIKVMFFEQNEHTITKDELKNKMSEKIMAAHYNLLTKIAQEGNDISIYIIDYNIIR